MNPNLSMPAKSLDTNRERVMVPLAQWLKDHRNPLWVFVVTRGGLVLMIYLSMLLLPARSGPDLWSAFPENPLLNGWSRWDSAWYVDIATHGYMGVPRYRDELNVRHWPLYPLTIRALNPLVKNSHLSALIVSNLSFLIALILLFDFTKAKFDEKTATRTVVLLSVYPFSWCFTAAYSESLYLALVLSAFSCGEKRRWPAAGFFAALASATRVMGFLTVFGLLLLYLEKIAFDYRKIRGDILWILVGVSGFVAYSGYLGFTLGDPLLFSLYRNAPTQAAGYGFDGFMRLFQTAGFQHLAIAHIALVFGVAGALFCLVAWRKIGIAYAAWSLSCIGIGFIGWTGLGRYLAPVFPLFIALAMVIKRPLPYWSWCYVSSLLLALFSIMFSHWYNTG